MAKELQFTLNDKLFSLEALKLERKKLYGWTDKVAVNAKDEPCKTVSLMEEEGVLLPKGSSGLGSIDEKGIWVDKSELIAYDENGKEAPLVPSSFDEPIVLDTKITEEELLEHNITSVYSLQGEELYPDFIEFMKNKDGIYTFEFNYRADYEGDPAFLVENGGELFVMVGKKTSYEFVGLEEAVILDEDEENSDELDEFDFGMM